MTLLRALVVALPLAVVATVPAAAAETDPPRVVSEQLVISQLDASGLPTSSELVTQVTTTDLPYGKVVVPTSTADLRFLDRRGRPDTEGEAAALMMGGAGQEQVILGSTFTQPLPVAMHAEYFVDGTIRDPATIGGAGELEVRYTVLNTVVSTQTITYKDSTGAEQSREEKVFAPFAGALQITLPKGAELRSAVKGVVSTGDQGQTIVTWNAVLYPPIGNYQLTFVARMYGSELAVPAARLDVVPVTKAQDPAVGFSATLLTESVKGNSALTKGLTEINSSALSVARGAAELESGLIQLADGTDQLSAAASGQLLPGAEQIASGAQQQAAGQSSLAGGISSSASGAASLASGAAAVSSGLNQVSGGLDKLVAPSGVPAIEQATKDLLAAVTALADAVGSPDDPPLTDPPSGTPTLIQVATASASAATALKATATTLSGALSAAVPTATSAASNAGQAASAVQGVYAAACVPTPTTLTSEQCAALATAASQAASASTDAASVATTLGQTAAGAAGLGKGLGALHDGLVGLVDGLDAVSVGLRSGSSSTPGVQEGLAAVVDGLTTTSLALSELSSGASQTAAGAESLESGANDLSSGLDTVSQGAAALASAASQLAAGTTAQQSGTAQLATGLTSLADAAGSASAGGADLADGASALQQQGTAEILAQTIDASSDPAFARAYLTATSKAADSAAPYDAPKDGVAKVAYVSQIAAGTPAAGLGSEGGRSAAVLGLVVVVAAALVALAVRRVRIPATPHAGSPEPGEPADL